MARCNRVRVEGVKAALPSHGDHGGKLMEKVLVVVLKAENVLAEEEGGIVEDAHRDEDLLEHGF